MWRRAEREGESHLGYRPATARHFGDNLPKHGYAGKRSVVGNLLWRPGILW